MNTAIDYANTDTKTKMIFRRKACVIDLRNIQREEKRFVIRKKKFFIFSLAILSIIASSTLAANAEDVKTSATVLGWYEVKETSNERIDVTTNMAVYVNGQRFETN